MNEFPTNPHFALEYNPDWTWQENAREKRAARNQPDWTQIAGVGSGKTLFSLKCVKDDFDAKITKAALFFAPTIAIRDGFVDEAAKMGLNIDPEWLPHSQKTLREGFHGAAFTYAAAKDISLPLIDFLKKTPTTSVFDEWHHIFDDENSGWLSYVRMVLTLSTRRIRMSGTMFRTEGKIAGIAVNSEGYAIADDEFQYRFGVAADINRGVEFPFYDGPTEFEKEDGTRYEFHFADPKSEVMANKLLNAALTEGNFLSDMLKAANNKLNDQRRSRPEGIPDTQGRRFLDAALAVCIDIKHAEKVVGILKSLGEDPVLVHSDEKGSHDAIRSFKKSERRWIVSVGMVTEGVNIPRITVGVWASNITAPMCVLQGIGRAVRRIGPVDDIAYWYFPKDQRFEKIAWVFMNDHKFALQEKGNGPPQKPGDGSEPKKKDRVVSSAGELASVVFDGRNIEPQEYLLCDKYVAAHKIPISTAKFANIAQHFSPEMRALMKKEVDEATDKAKKATVKDAEQKPRHEVLNDKRAEIEVLVGRLAKQMLTPGEDKLDDFAKSKIIGEKMKSINIDFMKRWGKREDIGDPAKLDAIIQDCKDRLNKNKKAENHV